MLRTVRGQQRALGVRKRGSVSLAYDNDASIYLSRLGGVTKSYAAAVNRLFVRLKATGIWPLVKSGYLLCGPTASAGIKNIVPGAGDATVSGPTHSAYKGFSGVGNGLDGSHQMVFANTGSAAFPNAKFGWAFAGQSQIGQAPYDYNDASTNWGWSPNSNILTDSSGQAQGFKRIPAANGLGGRGTSWAIGDNSATTPVRILLCEGPADADARPFFGFLPRGGQLPYAGGSLPSYISGNLQIQPVWYRTIPRHSVWIFVSCEGSYPASMMANLADAVSDFCDEVGCLN